MSILLRVDRIEAAYGDVTAVSLVSLEVQEGETVALIGANGAGKTTTLRALSGLLPLRRGAIEFEGERLDGLGPAELAARGIAHVRGASSSRRDVSRTSAGGTLGAGRCAARKASGGCSSCFLDCRTAPAIRRHAVGRRAADVRYRARADGGPKLLMLDEPSLGLAPS
jgi:branched-chain amino acid transport system ATP-binding protein